MRKFARIASSEQDDDTFTRSLKGAIRHLEDERLSFIRSAYAAEYDVFPAVYDDEFIFTGLNASVTSVTAHSGRDSEELTGFVSYPYSSNGSLALRFDYLPVNCGRLTVLGAAGAAPADFPEDLAQAIGLTFGRFGDRQEDNKNAIEALMEDYRFS